MFIGFDVGGILLVKVGVPTGNLELPHVICCKGGLIMLELITRL